MYAALINNQLVTARNVAKQTNVSKQKFICPNCCEPVQLVSSNKIPPYFRHPNTNFRQAETMEHQLGKRLLFDGLKKLRIDCKLETALVSKHLRADVYVIYQCRSYGLEIQCAPLRTGEYRIRHELYRRGNICDVWLLGRRHFLRKKLKQIHLDLLQTNDFWGNYIIEIDVQKRQLRLKYNILQNDLNKNCLYQTKTFTLNEAGIQQLFQFRPSELEVYFHDLSAEKKYAELQVRQQSSLGLAIAQACYCHGLTPFDLPLDLFVGYRKPGKRVILLEKINKRQQKS